jgi:phenylalanyl-tRNA synthetase beta chain
MPVIGIPLDLLRKRLGADLPGERLLRVLEEIGCDVEGFARLKRTRCRACGWIEERTETEESPARCDRCDADHRQNPASIEDLADLEVVRMELLAVRPDMFDPGGLARALRGYLDVETGPVAYEVGPVAARVRVDASVRDARSSRPFIACAVLEGARLDGDLVKVVMKLQENLHWALGRNRKLASIGVYDFDTIAPDLEYSTEEPDRGRFVPLGATDGQARSLREILAEHPKGRAYKHLLESFERYPILRDSRGQVLSMPPIINSEETKVHLGSTRLFIDVTGTGERIVQRALNILVTSLMENLPGVKARAVSIDGASTEDGKAARPTTLSTPDLSPQKAQVHVGAASRLIGVSLTTERAANLLERMRHGVRVAGTDLLEVAVPAYRNDILHERDLMEDLAIAYGYHRIVPELLPARTVGRALPLEDLTGSVRDTLCGLGFHEVMTLVLSNDEESDLALGMNVDGRAVRIENPISGEQTRLRTRLIPGLLQVFRHNLHQPLPQRIFEVGDVTWLDPEAETEAVEQRMISFALISPKAGFTDARALAEAIVREFGVEVEWEPAQEAPFLTGRCARIRTAAGDPIGILGEIDPEVLERLGLENPVATGELWLEGLAGRPPRLQFSLDR